MNDKFGIHYALFGSNPPIANKSGITIKELKDLLSNWPETNESGDPYEVWIETGKFESNVCTSIHKLNQGDIILETSKYK